MQTLAGKLDWLKERKDFQKNPVARIATRLLQSQYMPYGEDLYPWVLREIRRGNIQLPSEWQEGGAWHKLIEMEMSAEQELARRNALVNDPEWGNNTPKEWWDDDKPIDWENIQTAPWNKLTDTLDAFNNIKDSRYEDVWDAMMSANGGQQLRIPGTVTPEGERGNWYPIKPDQFKDWEKVLEDRAKRRKGIDPMQMSAPEFYQQMYNEWLPEWEDQHRQGLGEVVHHFPDKWTIRKLQNEEEAQREGDEMGHCLGVYGPEIENQRTHVYSLRDPRNHPHATFEIRPNKLDQRGIPREDFERFGIEPGSDMVEHTHFLMREMERRHRGNDPYRERDLYDIASPEWINELADYHDAPWGKLYNLAQYRLQQPAPRPTNGQLIQVQGKENSPPTPQYQDRIRDWFGSMPQEHWPSNLEDTAYNPEPPKDGWPDHLRQWDEVNDPDEPDPHLARTEEHYPSPAHERITGEICHCPWGPQRDLWSWSDDAGSLGHERLRDHQRHARRPDAVDHAVTDDAALAEPRVGVVKSQPERDREVPGKTAGGTTRRLRRVDMLASLGDGANTLWTQPECSKVPVGSLDHRMAAEGTVPPEVDESSILVKEDDKPLHNRVILADSWDYEPPEDFLVPDFEPWSLGHDGKGLMNQDGEIITWRTNAMGEPHHDVISAEENFPYVVKLNIYPNGKVFIPSPDELHLFGISREDATNLLEQQKLPSGLMFDPRFTAKTAMPYDLRRDWRWHGGGCGEYALALHQRHPALRFGVQRDYNDNEYRQDIADGWTERVAPVKHAFAHDDQYAYDIHGRHPLPYDNPERAWTGEYDIEPEHFPHELPWDLDTMGGMTTDGAHQHIEQHGDPTTDEYNRTAKLGAQPQVLYHHTYPENAESIEREGLHPRYERGADELEEGQQPATFLTTDPNWRNGDWDPEYAPENMITYEVNTEGLPLESDAPAMDVQTYPQLAGQQWYYTPQPIPPERIRRIAANQPTVMYHVAPADARESIEQNGLDATRSAYDRWSQGTGLHGFTDLNEAKWYQQMMSTPHPIGFVEPEDAGPMDIWEAQPHVALREDSGLTSSDEPSSAVYHSEPIPPERIRRIAAANPEPPSDSPVDANYWIQGGCGEYACALHDRNPALQFGQHVEYYPEEADEGENVPFATNHVFVHDDQNAYDALGTHPLPYDGSPDWAEDPSNVGTRYGVARPDIEGEWNIDPEMVQEAHRWIDYFDAHDRSKHESKAHVCPTCGDPLKGEHGTFCPRCQWSEENAMLDHDPLSNPPDPTVDMHRGIQASIPSHRWAKWYEGTYDSP